MITYEVSVYDSGGKFWKVNRKLHRLDGPAIEYENGNKSWFIDGKLHRTSGPAVEYADGYKEYWINGKFLTEKEFLEKTKPAKEMTLHDVNKILGFKVKIVE